jgi:hypothetical protein
VLFDLPVDEWNRRGQEEAEKRSGECGWEKEVRRESNEMIYGASSPCVPASLLFSPRVQAFSYVTLANACPAKNVWIKRDYGANFWADAKRLGQLIDPILTQRMGETTLQAIKLAHSTNRNRILWREGGTSGEIRKWSHAAVA